MQNLTSLSAYKTTSAVSHMISRTHAFSFTILARWRPSQFQYKLHAMQYQYILHATWPDVDQWALRKHSGHIINIDLTVDRDVTSFETFLCIHSVWTENEKCAQLYVSNHGLLHCDGQGPLVLCVCVCPPTLGLYRTLLANLPWLPSNT